MALLCALAPALPCADPTSPEEDRWLVELDLPPALLDRSADRAAAALAADREFRDALLRLDAGPPSRKPAVVRRFDLLWSGYAVEAGPETARRIESLPGVRRVLPDRPVRALLDGTVPHVGANLLHDRLPPVRGSGVRVAVLDTGIDYDHDDLGGGIGPAFRVVRGWDFVDDDNDPMDEHGHGTHIAGAAVGDGTIFTTPLPGVAPGATILAGRVLNADAWGSQSQLISGLEWAADPDGDPGTDDAAHVVLMALGGFGHPDDPVSLAVDSLVSSGVLVVAAAGNAGGSSGTRYQSIFSPGAARMALTVGATDDSDSIGLELSSRGFTGSFLPKPDMTAPGYDVCSARWDSWLPPQSCGGDGKHVENDGTSVAAAHVAGAAALVMEVNPSWSAEVVGAVLRETSLDLGFDLLTQGSGRLQATAAADADAVVLPPVLMPGRVDLCAPAWSGTAPFLLRNLGGSAADFDLVVQGSLPAGVTAGLDTPSVALPGGQEATVTLRVDVDLSTAPVVDTPPFGYEGVVLVTSPTRPGLLLRVPFWVPASPSLPLSFGFDPEEVYIHDRAGTTWRYIAPGREMDVALPAGSYDILAATRGPQLMALREGAAVDACGSAPVWIDSADAPNAVEVTWEDVGGAPLPAPPPFCDIVLRHDSGFVYEAQGPAVQILQLPDASAAYRIEWSCSARNAAGDLHLATGSSTGLSDHLQVDTGPADWRLLEVADLREPGQAWFGASLARTTLAIGDASVSDPDLNGPGPDPPGLVRSVWLTPLPYEEFSALSGLTFTVGGDPHPPDAEPASLQSILALSRDASIDIVFPRSGTTDPLHSLPSSGGRLNLGLAPFAWAAATSNVPPMWLRLQPSVGGEMALFRGQFGTHRPEASGPGAGLPYEIRQGGNPVQSGLLVHGGSGFQPPVAFLLEPNDGLTELEVAFPAYQVGGVQGTSNALLTMDLRPGSTDSDPPALRRLQMLVGGEPAGSLPDCSSTGILSARFTEAPPLIASLEAEVRPHGAALWTPLAPSVSGDGFQAQVANLGSDGPVDLRLFAADAAGNSLEVRSEPAWTEGVGGGTSDPGNSVALARSDADVVLSWQGPPAGPYRVRAGESLPLTPADTVAPSVTALTWTDTGAAGDGRGLVYYQVRGSCP